MSIRHSELEINPDNPFITCKLNRKKYAGILTNIIDSYPTGFSLAINNKWGTGKTTFIRMWEQELKNNSYRTLYFNAWENDFEDNALTALMGELKTLTKNNEAKPQFNKALKTAATLSKHITPILVQAIADKYINTEFLKDSIVNVTKGVSDIFENEVNEYANKKKSIREFRQSLTEFISKTTNDTPLIFFIDELDRCRPNYAVSILEQIKHFFSVSNIVFVLSIDKIQLGNAIRGVYGSENIDADEYLRRFIDIEYSIPEPEEGDYYKYLYEYFKFGEFFNSEMRINSRELASDGNEFLQISDILFNGTSISLRQQEKIFTHARLALRCFKTNEYVIPVMFLLITYLKVVDEQLYNQIKNGDLSIKQLQQKFLAIVQNKLTEEKEILLMWFEAQLLLYYNNYINGSYNRKQLYERDGTIKTLRTKSIISPTKEKDFLEKFERIDLYGGGHLDINHF